MLTLDVLKQELGIQLQNRDQDVDLVRMLRSVIGRIRQQTERPLHWAADGFTVESNVLTVRSIGHGLRTGATVRIASATTTTAVNGDYAITRIDQDRFTVTLAAAVSDSAAWNEANERAAAVIHPEKTVAAKPSTSKDLWIPQRALPWLAATEVAVWDGEVFDPLDSDDWYVESDGDVFRAGRICSTTRSWDVPHEIVAGRMGLTERVIDRNFQISYRAGAPECPPDIAMAVLSLASDLYELQGSGKDRQGESHEGSSVSRMSGEERREHLLSATAVLANWRAR